MRGSGAYRQLRDKGPVDAVASSVALPEAAKRLWGVGYARDDQIDSLTKYG